MINEKAVENIKTYGICQDTRCVPEEPVSKVSPTLYNYGT